jgi:hypothetical protein
MTKRSFVTFGLIAALLSAPAFASSAADTATVGVVPAAKVKHVAQVADSHLKILDTKSEPAPAVLEKKVEPVIPTGTGEIIQSDKTDVVTDTKTEVVKEAVILKDEKLGGHSKIIPLAPSAPETVGKVIEPATKTVH